MQRYINTLPPSAVKKERTSVLAAPILLATLILKKYVVTYSNPRMVLEYTWSTTVVSDPLAVDV